MSFKTGCCNLCAWFSTIGAVCFIIFAYMISNKNAAVIEHKFHISLEDTAGLNAAHHQMIVMTIVMIAMSALCFIGSFASDKQDREQAIMDKINAEQAYSCIFGDDKIERPNNLRNIEL